MPTIDVNGATLYYEQRGDGPPLVFISGAGGDAGYWTEAAEALADEYTVLTYDRRANSRSPRPPDWDAAPIDEQSDDTAALLSALGLAPAIAYGNSLGAEIAINVALRHPEVLRAVVAHEPPFLGVTSAAGSVGPALESLVTNAMNRGGPPLAMEEFCRWVAGDAVYESFDPVLRQRLLDNGAVFFALEMSGAMSYLPSADDLARVAIPRVAACGVDNSDPASDKHWFCEAAQWLAERWDSPLVHLPGGHVPQASHPEDFVAELRPLLTKLA